MTYLTDDGLVYHALSVRLSRAKLITCLDDRYAKANFSKSGVWDKVTHGYTLISVDTRISLEYSVGLVERSRHGKKQIDLSIHFDITLTCDRARNREREIGYS